MHPTRFDRLSTSLAVLAAAFGMAIAPAALAGDGSVKPEDAKAAKQKAGDGSVKTAAPKAADGSVKPPAKKDDAAVKLDPATAAKAGDAAQKVAPATK